MDDCMLYDRISKHDKNSINHLLNLSRKQDYRVCIWGFGKIGTSYGYGMLRKLGIEVDFFCDSDEGKVGKDFDNIKCVNLSELLPQKNNIIFFILVGYSSVAEVYELLNGFDVPYVVTLDDILELNEIRSFYMPFLSQNKIAVYTSITGNYDLLRNPLYKSENCDYFVISDNNMNESSEWNHINMDDYVTSDVFSGHCNSQMLSILKNRYCKMFPDIFFSEYRYSIYIDGNLTLKKDMSEWTTRLPKSRIGVAARNNTDCLSPYIIRSYLALNDGKNNCIEQARRYYLEGMPDDIGSYLCNVLVREHNNPICKRIMKTWWEEFSIYQNRDQNAFPYALWKNGFSRDDVLVICDELKVNPYKNCPYWDYEKKHLRARYLVE